MTTVTTDREGRALAPGNVVEFGRYGNRLRRGQVTTVQPLWVRVRTPEGRACTVRPYKVKRVA